MFSFHISRSFGEVRIIKSHCFEALATQGSNLGGDSLVDSVFDELSLVSNTDELLVVTLACLDAVVPVCRLLPESLIYPKTNRHNRYNLTVPLKGHSAGRLRGWNLSVSLSFCKPPSWVTEAFLLSLNVSICMQGFVPKVMFPNKQNGDLRSFDRLRLPWVCCFVSSERMNTG